MIGETKASHSTTHHTKMQNVAGLSSAEAQKSSDMYMKCRYLDEKTGSKGAARCIHGGAKFIFPVICNILININFF